MKKFFVAFMLVILVVGGMYFYQGGGTQGAGNGQTASLAGGESSRTTGASNGQKSSLGLDTRGFEEDEGYVELDDRPAAEIYKTAEAAIQAVRAGAVDYDDIVLEQFVEPGEDCTWCPEFYTSVHEMMLAPEANEDERSYYSEILAISGKIDNIQALVQAVEDSGDSENADIFGEALELTIGGDDVVQYLSSYLDSENELLQESVVAAVTNQGSKLAAETLYKHTVETGDPDGYYSLGIGLAELIPEEETLPYLQELVNTRNDYSHLAVKALLNYGVDGLQIVMDSLTSSGNAEFDTKMLTDALDHVSYEEEVEEYLKKTLASSKDPVVTKFAREILEDFDVEGLEEDEFEEEEALG